MTTVRVEGEVARAGAGLHGGERWVVRGQRARLAIELIDQQLVEAEVGRDGESVRGVEVDRVRVRSLLPSGVDARTGVLLRVGRRPESAVGPTGRTATLPLP